jgi:hypothetical protein
VPLLCHFLYICPLSQLRCSVAVTFLSLYCSLSLSLSLAVLSLVGNQPASCALYAPLPFVASAFVSLHGPALNASRDSKPVAFLPAPSAARCKQVTHLTPGVGGHPEYILRSSCLRKKATPFNGGELRTLAGHQERPPREALLLQAGLGRRVQCRYQVRLI